MDGSTPTFNTQPIQSLRKFGHFLHSAARIDLACDSYKYQLINEGEYTIAKAAMAVCQGLISVGGLYFLCFVAPLFWLTVRDRSGLAVCF